PPPRNPFALQSLELLGRLAIPYYSESLTEMCSATISPSFCISLIFPKPRRPSRESPSSSETAPSPSSTESLQPTTSRL
ncbi:unnamed protein product, partial [Sphagnum balticum]